MFNRSRSHIGQRIGRSRFGAILAAVAVLSLLSGCIVYVEDPPHRHYYWR
jgi:hypothetical protein